MINVDTGIEFQSTPPVKAATSAKPRTSSPARFQSTPPVKAATNAVFVYLQDKNISIHAAREGGDLSGHSSTQAECISIHAAREGGDATHGGTDKEEAPFQSTPPVKAATVRVLPVPPRGAISIHAAREGGDSRD